MFIENGHLKKHTTPESHHFNLHHFYKHAIPPASVFLSLITGKTTFPTDSADTRSDSNFCVNQRHPREIKKK